MKTELLFRWFFLAFSCAAWVTLPGGLAFGQAAAEEPPPPKKSKLDIPEEEEPPAKKPAAKPAAGAAEEAPPKKSKLDTPEEEEAPPKKPAKPGMGEEEAPPRKKTPSPLSVAEGEDEDSQEKPERVCDHVFLGPQFIEVRLFEIPFEWPVPKHLLEKEVELPPHLTSSEKGIIKEHRLGKTITGVRYYEHRMLQKAAEALRADPARIDPKEAQRLSESGALVDLSVPEAQKRADKAEQILVTALAEHDSAVQANLRKGVQWEPRVRQPLVQALLNIRLNRADLLLAEGKLDPALRYCDSLWADFRDAPGAGAIRSRFERLFLTQAEQARQRGQHAADEQNQAAEYAEARRLLDELSRRFSRESSEAIDAFRDDLIGEARGLLKQAQALPPERARDATALLARAAIIWPELPGLESVRKQFDDQYPTLRCAYTSLPQNLSPMLASSPVERHAVSLLFESLVRWWDGGAAGDGGHHEPQLAEGRPVSRARGRQFYLHDARWSDSTPDDLHRLTLADVQATVKLLGAKGLPGYLPAWAKLVRSDVQPVHSDPFTACILLERDYWQPLAMMDFKIIPRRSFPQGTAAELALFNKHPVGTGPYVLAESAQIDEVRFVANPQYRQPGLPHIKEIVFHRLGPAVAKEQFLQRKVHLMYDVQPEHVAEIRQQQRTVKTITNHSAWFLAPRHDLGKPADREGYKSLWLAISHHLDRNKILNQFYRVGNPTDHVELTGPFPRKSWAYNPDKSLVFTPSLAGAHIDAARKKLNSIPALRLVYPGNDPITAQACTEIQKQLAAAPLNLNIALQAVLPEDFSATLDAGNFELAYWRHDFKDQTYWLWPLFDPEGIGPGGTNFMRYYQDKDLANLFAQLNSHKRFPEIQKLTHQVHEHVFKNGIVIPLWQLDTYVAVDDALKNVWLDPWVLYGNVEQWNLQLRSK